MVTDNIVSGDHQSCVSRAGRHQEQLAVQLEEPVSVSARRLDAVSLLRSSLMNDGKTMDTEQPKDTHRVASPSSPLSPCESR